MLNSRTTYFDTDSIPIGRRSAKLTNFLCRVRKSMAILENRHKTRKCNKHDETATGAFENILILKILWTNIFEKNKSTSLFKCDLTFSKKILKCF